MHECKICAANISDHVNDFSSDIYNKQDLECSNLRRKGFKLDYRRKQKNSAKRNCVDFQVHLISRNMDLKVKRCFLILQVFALRSCTFATSLLDCLITFLVKHDYWTYQKMASANSRTTRGVVSKLAPLELIQFKNFSM